MDAIDNLISRKSHNKLIEPAPSQSELETIFQAALRAPDHAALTPWRFDVFQGEGLMKLGERFARASIKQTPDLASSSIDKIKGKALRAPLVIVASAAITQHPKVPEIEQILSVGAACQNILLACHALGYGAIWRTGNLCFNPFLNECMDWEPTRKAVGFIYVGSIDGQLRPIPKRDLADFVQFQR